MRDAQSPSVDRLLTALPPTPTTSDWLLGLLEDEDGRPAALLLQLGHELITLREEYKELPALSCPVQPLINHARKLALQLRADPLITTDLLFLAVLRHLEEADTLFPGLTSHDLRPLIERPLPQQVIVEETQTLPSRGATAWSSKPVEVQLDRPGILRILDVNANRALEACRVLDDYARFHRNDGILTESLKSFRHQLAGELSQIPTHDRLAHRDTLHDAGTQLSAPGEYTRQSCDDVAQRNLHRLQESLRSLEEFTKILGYGAARNFEALRYQSYTLEKALLRTVAATERLAGVQLYWLLTGAQCATEIEYAIAEAAAGGVQIIQLREKDLPDRELLSRAKVVRKATRRAEILFIMNDRPDLARLVEADGVHLGQDDLPVEAARQLLGSQAIIGVSTHCRADLVAAIHAGTDYVGIGPVFPSSTKKFSEYAGLEFVREVA
ncbi:MAG: thiamine phosphate synthase, partial [Gemmataceae bacterium]